MATLVSGTPQTRTEHSRLLAPLGFMASMGIPAVILIVGIAAEGWGAISWQGAALWGVLATAAFTMFSMMGSAMGMTRMNLLDLLGSTMAPPGSKTAKRLGAAMHFTNGFLLAATWVYITELFGVSADWPSAMAWGAFLWVLALLMMSTMGALHPAVRGGEQDDPGVAATNFGLMTPVGSLMGHLVWGAVLGFGFALWPA